MTVEILAAEGTADLQGFLDLHDRVYAERPVRWPALVPYQEAILSGKSPMSQGRRMLPLVARESGEVVARVLAFVDERYIEHWDEPLGHTGWFEALPGTREAVRELMSAACSWLREQGMRAARAGFGLGEFPFVIDDYDSLPAFIARQNPASYHALLKDAGFESEQGWVDYKIEVTPDLVARWERAVDAATTAGYVLTTLGELPRERAVADFARTWNEAFDRHWGAVPFTEAELAHIFDLQRPLGLDELSLIAYFEGEPAGAVWVFPELTALALRAPGREVREDERLNNLGIAVRAPHRGRGLNLAMASHAYLELVRRGAKWLSYTLVLDHNRPSRRTAEKLGAHAWASYMVYRRNFGPPRG